jgi:hypothetical protein
VELGIGSIGEEVDLEGSFSVNFALFLMFKGAFKS